MPEPAYVWSVEGAPVRVELERGVARKMREALAESGKEEIGGFLLGTAQGGVTRISGYELVECEHRRGEAYDLTPLDRLKFSRRVAPWLNKRPHEPRAVGFFRTHARPGLFLDARDFRTVQEFFADPGQVVLLVRPEAQGSAVAGFFFWDAGMMERRKSLLPFALDDAARDADAPAVALPASNMAMVPTRPAAARPAAANGAASGWRYGLLAACIPLAAGLAYYAGRHEATARAASARPVAAAPAPMSAPASAAPVVAQFPMPVKRSPMETPASIAKRARRQAEEEEEDAAGAFGPRRYQAARLQPMPAARPEAPPRNEPVQMARLESPPREMRPEPAPEAAPQRFRPELHPAVTVEAGGPSSGLGRKLVRLPRRLLALGRRHEEDDFTPARPLREVTPSVPPRVAQSLTGVVPVAVRISVDAGGRVRDTELLSDPANPQLANLAINAARKWEFLAARQNDTPVASSVVARFSFRPPLYPQP